MVSIFVLSKSTNITNMGLLNPIEKPDWVTSVTFAREIKIIVNSSKLFVDLKKKIIKYQSFHKTEYYKTQTIF